jgi:hypothetical protein
MAGSTIYEVRYAVDEQVHGAGARRTRDEAEQLLDDVKLQHQRDDEANARNLGSSAPWDRRYWIEEIDTTGLFAIPPRPTPRERYSATVERVSHPDAWTKVQVEIRDRDRLVATYDRNYAMLDTFEPFRQGDRDFALISPNYTATSVIDLATGEIVAAEEPNAAGFCPVGFYVPDWWDVHEDSEGRGVLPGSLWWAYSANYYEWPSKGDFGFVWGCIWGDDTSWKVQYLDLSDIQAGVIRRDDRFGYVKLATHPKLRGPDFIRFEGRRRIEFSTLQTFDRDSGRLVNDWDDDEDESSESS